MGIVLRIVNKLGVAGKYELLAQMRVLRKLGPQRPVHDAFPHVVPVCTQGQAGVSPQSHRTPGGSGTPDKLLKIEFNKFLGLIIMFYSWPTTVIQLDRVLRRITKYAVRTREVIPEKDSLHLEC